jgi:glycosyltransferase involved in cell wall biosynthesis
MTHNRSVRLNFWLCAPLTKERKMNKKNGLLMAANWESGVGYAWWLMESFWKVLAEHHDGHSVIAYPKITTTPAAIAECPARTAEINFTTTGSLVKQCRFVRANAIKTIYLTDQPTWHWRYAVWRIAGVRRIVTHDHTPGLRTAPKGIKRWIKAAIQRLPWITVNLAIGATDFVRQRLIDVACVPEHKTASAPNGLPSISVDAIDVRAEFGIAADRLILVSTGRAAPIKNIDFALRLIALVDGVHFLHIGDGPDLPRLQAIADTLGITDRVTWAGKRSDVPAILAGCDIAIQPSRGEVGYSLSMLEYMRAGLPVLAPDNKSVSGCVEDGVTGLIYRENCAESAMEKLMTLTIIPNLRRPMGERGAKRVAEHFSLLNTHLALISAMLTSSP